MIEHAVIFFVLTLTACIGAGYVTWIALFQRFSSGENVISQPSPLELGVIGLFTISILATLINFVAPVSHTLAAVVVTFLFLTGVVNLINRPKPGLIKLLVIASVITLFAFWGSKFLLSYDAGLYHLQAISWMKDEPIVLGLANLHDRLGFNSLVFSAFALFWLPFFEVEGLLLANYLPAIFTVVILLNHLLKSSQSNNNNVNASTLFALFGIASVAGMPTLLFSNTTSTDLAPNIYTLLSAFLFLRACEAQDSSMDEIFKSHVLLWVIALFALLTKLSALSPALLALCFSLRYHKTLGSLVIRYTAYFLTIVFSIWVLRNFILSGCLIFPLGVTCASTELVHWGVGSDGANLTRAAIEWWAKTESAEIPLENLGQHWLRDWIHLPKRGGLLAQIVFSMAGLPLIVLLYLFYLSMKQKGSQGKFRFIQNSHSTGLLWVLLSSVAGLLFGFLTAPDPRFWWGSLITLMILLPLATLIYLNLNRPFSLGSFSVLPIILCSFIFLGSYVFLLDPMEASAFFSRETHKLVLPRTQVKAVHSKILTVYVPASDDRCWLTAKPCSPTDPTGLSSEHIGHYLVFNRMKN